MKRKQGRVTERSRPVREGEKGGKKKILFHGNVCAYLTSRPMGDPVVVLGHLNLELLNFEPPSGVERLERFEQGNTVKKAFQLETARAKAQMFSR